MSSPEHWIAVAHLPPTLDIELLEMEMDRYRVNYRIVQGQGEVILEVSSGEEIEAAISVLREHQRMLDLNEGLYETSSLRVGESLIQQAHRLPMVVVTLFLGLCGALLVSFFPKFLHWFTFQDFYFKQTTGILVKPAENAFERGQYWRLLTPTFLHFGLLHLIFNSLWIWEFGRRIELIAGKFNFILISLAIALGANVAQYLWQPDQLFGGLSGVVYGFLGYIWLRNIISPNDLLRIPNGIIILMLVWLIICWLGVVDLFIQGGVANGAHIFGFLIGLIFGGLAGFSDKSGKTNELR